jgi:hypothetical protein
MTTYWTGHKNAACPEKPMEEEGGCGFFEGFGAPKGKCGGCAAAHFQVQEAAVLGSTFQIGPKQGDRTDLPSKEFDCPRASDCQWQKSSKDLCPPRTALKLGVDPRYCAW